MFPRIKSIHVLSPTDRGVPMVDSEHEKYCKILAQAVGELYRCSVTVEPDDDVNTTMIQVDFIPWWTNEDLRIEIIKTVKSISQDVWEQGDFWE